MNQMIHCFLNLYTDVDSMKLNILFTINTILLTYNFVKAWKSDPGFIDTNREQKMKVTLALNEGQSVTMG